MIPERKILLLSGIPATGKSTFAKHLARTCGFADYDLECYPRGWPHPELKAAWDSDRSDFLALLRKYHDRVVLDWGFPPTHYSWIKELTNQGVELIWFDGDFAAAQRVFEGRGGISLKRFTEQIEAIKKASYPASLNCVIVPALSADGVFEALADIERRLFL